MNMQFLDVLKEINEIFINVLDDESIVIKPETTANDIDAWDSLNNIQLVVAIEKRFKVRFTTGDIYSWKNVGDMCKAITEKCVA